jgi:hypothetical protein
MACPPLVSLHCTACPRPESKVKCDEKLNFTKLSVEFYQSSTRHQALALVTIHHARVGFVSTTTGVYDSLIPLAHDRIPRISQLEERS